MDGLTEARWHYTEAAQALAAAQRQLDRTARGGTYQEIDRAQDRLTHCAATLAEAHAALQAAIHCAEAERDDDGRQDEGEVRA